MLTFWFFPQRFSAEEQERIIEENCIKKRRALKVPVRCEFSFCFFFLMPFKILLKYIDKIYMFYLILFIANIHFQLLLYGHVELNGGGGPKLT